MPPSPRNDAVRTVWIRRAIAVALALAAVTLGILISQSRALEASPTAADLTRSTASAERPSFSGDAAYAHVQALASGIGPRVAGAENYDRAVTYLADYWRSLGYQPSVLPFTFTGYEEREVRVDISSTGQSIYGSMLRGAPGGFAESAVVDVGLGRPEDIRGRQLQGRIALIKRGEIRFSDKVNNAAEAGAIAVIVDNHQPGGFNGSLSGPSPIPAIGVSQEDGGVLRAHLDAGPTVVALRADAGTVELSGSNVATTSSGTSSRQVIIGAHLDSVNVGQGANDNASGVAVITEISRAVLGHSYPFAVRFVAFGAEEVGLIGSNRYVAEMSETERASTIAMINLDMVGVGDQWRFGGTADLVNHALAASSELGAGGGRLGAGLNTASDHASFMEAGIPSVFVHRFDDPNYHTAGDVAEMVDAANLETAGNIVLLLLDRLAEQSV